MIKTGTILPSIKWYQYYINPFELLNLQDKHIDAEDIDLNQIKKLKKLLINEIELEDGNIAWMSNLTIDKAKALNVCGALNNNQLLKFHISIFNDKKLLNFLSRGDHSCFNVNTENVPLAFKQQKSVFNQDTILILINQFNLVITQVIKARKFAIIKNLFNCRYWIPDLKLQLLFEKTNAVVNKHLNNLELVLKQAKKQNISWEMIEQILYKDGLFYLINELPQDLFREQQTEILALLNAIAVTIGNRKGDFKLESKILQTAQDFSFKSTKYNLLIKKNLHILLHDKIHKSFNDLEKILHKAKTQDISWEMIANVLYQDSLIAIIKKLPKNEFEVQNNIMLKFLNAIAVVVANKEHYSLAIKILETAQNFSKNYGYGEIKRLIEENLQNIRNNASKGKGVFYFILAIVGIAILKSCVG